MGKLEKKLISFVVLAVMLVQTVFTVTPPISVSAAETTTTSIFTDYLPTINEVIDESGFRHPGVELTKEILENVRTQVRAQKEPWNSYFNAMIGSGAAYKGIGSSNQGGNWSSPASNVFDSKGQNSRFVADGLKAYTQALLYYITGDEGYRASAMHIIRIWSQMDPTKYRAFTDCHIHTGVPLNRMVTAAEILRYTSCITEELKWTDKDTADFTNNLIIPVTETFNHWNGFFMNQHLYPLLGSVSGYIFTGNKARYDEAVEWFTVNKTAVDQGQNGSIKQLFRLVDTNSDTGEKVDPPVVQLVEMGRDQAHSTGDVINATILSRLLMGQGTKVDPVEGTISTADNAVGPFEFLDDRILAGADIFANYMLGYDTPWIPTPSHTDMYGNTTVTYRNCGGWHRGRIGGNVYDLYYYYKYNRGINVEEKAPYFSEMFHKRHYFWWDSPDAGADYWLFIPKEAEAEGAIDLPKVNPNPDYIEMEYRTTCFDRNSAILQEGDTSFARVTATPEGSRIALVGCEYGTSLIGLKLRTNGPVKMEAFGNTLSLPDTKGQWKYLTYPSGVWQLSYFTVKGDGVTVDIDHINVKASEQLTPPVFTAGNKTLNLFTYLGSSRSINCDFSATDTNASDVVTYEADNLPEGAVLNVNTGAFTWTPIQSGTYSFVIKASDQTTISTRDVRIIVAEDRKSAVDVVAAGYNPNTVYISTTVENYNNVYNDVMSQIQSASDEVFHQKLLELYNAVLGLKELTPRLSDGSVNFVNMFAWSNFYGQEANLVTGSPDDFAGYYLAIDRTFYMDFGANFKISASAFDIQVRSGFPERIGGATIFGSNDNENWTRLTPGLTVVTDDMQRLEVQNDLRDKQFRFLKIQMIQPSSSMLEIAEFRIHGERHEAVNKITSVSISSDQSVIKRIVNGDTVKLNFQTTENINDVRVNIMGQNASVNSADGINWTAVTVMGNDVQTGKVKFSINYKTAKGKAAEEYIFTTDGSSLFVSNETDLINNIPNIANIIDPSTTWGRPNAAETMKQVNFLFDGDINTVPHFFEGGSGTGAYITFDFRAGNQVLLSNVEVIGRQDGNLFNRIGGAVVQGSNDNTTWTTISTPAWSTPDWQTLSINSTVPYRYIRMYNGSDWYVNIAELKLHGRIQSPLKDALNQAAVIDKGIYTAESVQLLEQAESVGTALVDSINATQVEVDAAVSNLLAALKGLQYIPGMPVLESLTDQTVIAGNKLTFTAHAVNSAADVEYGVVNLPAGAAFDAATQTFTWTPAKEHGSVYEVTFTATSSGLSSSKTIKIKVIGQPVIEPVSALELTAEQLFTYQVPASDPAGAPLVYSTDQLPAGTVFNPFNGVISWSPAQADYGSYPITFTVSNGSYSVSQTITFNVKLHILSPEAYTKNSYNLYRNEMTRIESEMAKSGADKVKLAAEIIQAEALLVQLPVSLYSFEGNANNTFGAHNATVFGTSTYQAGKVGQAINLNGSDSYVMLPATHPVSTYDEITLAAWVNWRGGNQWQRIFDFGNNTSQYMFLTPRSGSNMLYFGIKNGGSEQSVQTSQLPSNQWVHVAVTIGNGTAKLYVNGELKADTAGITIKPRDFKPSMNYIGKSQWPDPLLNGMIDEFNIYNYALSAEEIKAVANNSRNWVDKSLFTPLLTQAKEIIIENYTADTSAAFQTAYENVKVVDTNASATQLEIDIAAKLMQDALKGLQYIPGMPVFEALTGQTIIANNKLTFTVHAGNTDKEILYGTYILPAGAVFDAKTQTFEWTPAIEQGGIYPVTFTATAGDLTSHKTIKIKVIGQPVIESVAPMNVTAEQLFTYQLPASDPTGLPLTYSAQQLPTGAVLNASTGVLTWTPSQTDFGSYPVTFTVSNGFYSVSQTITFNVKLHILSPETYTKASYYLYLKEIARLEAEMVKPGADKVQLAAEVAKAQGILISTATLPADKITVTSSMVVASHKSWDKKFNPAQNGWSAFDSNTGTFTDTEFNPGWILIDLGMGNEQVVSSIKFYPRTNYQLRMNGMIIQGSKDGTNFVDLYTVNSVTQNEWYTFAINNTTAYRYIRIYSASANANVSEMEFYRPAKDSTLLTLLLEEAAAIDTSIYKEESVAALQAAVAEAQAVAANANATQTEIDAAANKLQVTTEKLRLPVTVTIDPAAPDGLNGWYVKPVTMTLESAELMKYSLDGGTTWDTYTQPILLDKEGNYNILYGSSDRNGNVYADYTSIVLIDIKAPDTAYSLVGTLYNNWYSSNVTVEFNALDKLSEVDKTEYRIGNSGEWLPYTAAIVLEQDGIYKVQYKSTDKAGNVEETKEVEIQIDKTAPTFTLEVEGQSITDGSSFDDNQSLSVKVSDNLSELAASDIIIDDTTYHIDTVSGSALSIDFTGKVGIHTARIVVKDNAGNIVDQVITFEVTTSIASISNLMERYVTGGELSAPLTGQLSNNLDQAQHQIDLGRLDQAAKHMEDFIKHLNNEALADQVTEKVKAILNADAKALAQKWSK